MINKKRVFVGVCLFVCFLLITCCLFVFVCLYVCLFVCLYLFRFVISFRLLVVSTDNGLSWQMLFSMSQSLPSLPFLDAENLGFQGEIYTRSGPLRHDCRDPQEMS